MSGIYIHIPFCRQACHYCDFHFSTSSKHRNKMVSAICKELELRAGELTGPVETLYFGGGTPSLLTAKELGRIIEQVASKYLLQQDAEITVEANPDDLTPSKINELSELAINRLSIGVQSFHDEDLKFMNRAHSSFEALKAIELASAHFENMSIDLIYGLPEVPTSRWEQNLTKAVGLTIPHLSCYALTVEPKTALQQFIEKGIVPPVNDDLAREHYELLLDVTQSEGYDNYEFSNFGREGYYSRNNVAYWTGRPYLGIGPSAHSFDGRIRSWNVSNNVKYIKSLEVNERSYEQEELSRTDSYNEYVMTRLRTIWGISLSEITDRFGEKFRDYLLQQAAPHIEEHNLYLDDDRLKVSRRGKFLTDGLAADLFLVNLRADTL